MHTQAHQENSWGPGQINSRQLLYTSKVHIAEYFWGSLAQLLTNYTVQHVIIHEYNFFTIHLIKSTPFLKLCTLITYIAAATLHTKVVKLLYIYI